MTKIKANQADIEDILNDPLAGATETKKGTVEIATQAEVDGGTDTARSITPLTLKNFTGTFEPADATILKDADIGITVQGYDATILVDADIGVNVEQFITKLTAFNKNFGTTVGTVSEGNHTHALDNLTDVVIGGSPLLSGHTLTYDGANWINQTPDSGVIDHLLLSNIGTNTHVQLDAHIVDSTIHFSTLDGLSDVIVAGSPAVTNQVLTFNGTNWVNADNTSVFTLDANDTLFAGTGAGASLTTGPDNFLAGAGAGTLIAGGGHNVAIGNDALAAVTTTNDTIGIGRNTLKLCTGNNNVAIGGFAGYRMTTSSINNILIGLQAGGGLVGTGNSDNIAIGTSALGNLGSSNTTAIQNIAIGSRSLDTLNGGDRNVAIGYNALTALTTGTDNTSVGDSSGGGITSGTGNVFLGTGTGWTNVSNELYIHNAASATPLIHGDFSATIVTINGTLIATGGVDALTSATTVIDVSLADAPTAGQVLTATNGTSATWETPTGGSGGSPVITVLDDLADVIIGGSPLTTNQVLTYDGSSWINADAQIGATALNDLTDVVIGGSPLLSGHTLTYDGVNWINQTPDSGVIDHLLLSNIGTNTHVQIDAHIVDSAIHFTTLDGLSDVIVAGSPAVTNQVLTFNGANWVNADVPTGVSVLDDLTDVTLGSPVTNEVLTFDGSNWINAGTTGEANKNWITAHNGVNFVNPPSAAFNNSIAIGDGATTGNINSIAIGLGADSGLSYRNVAIGQGATITGNNSRDSVAIGFNAIIPAISRRSVAIGSNSTSGYTSVAVGYNSTATATSAIAIGNGSNASVGLAAIGVSNTLSQSGQIVLGNAFNSGSTTTDALHSTRLGNGSNNNTKNFLHLFSRGKLELYGDEAQYVFPSYVVTGSPFETPANSVEGGVIYDSIANGLQVYDGASWSAIGGGAGATALNDLTDVTLGSPVTNEVLTFDGANWINVGTTGEANKNWLHADNGDNFAIAPSSTGVDGIALGNNASNSGADTIAIGTDADGSFWADAIAIGHGANIGGTDAVAVGTGATASKAGAIAIGNTANSGAGVSTIAIGDGAISTGTSPHSILIGTGAISASGSTYSIAIGKQAEIVAGQQSSIAIGHLARADLGSQVVIGRDIDSTKVTTNITHSLKIGSGVTGNVNILHLFSKGKLELVGDEAQYIFPSYVKTGSPFETPANSIEGGVIYDSVAKGLELYDGASWSAIGGGAGATALNDLTDVVVAGSPAVNGQVLTFDGSNWINSTPGVVHNWITGNGGSDFNISPTAAGVHALAGGRNATASGSRSTAFGYNTQATGGGCISMGTNALAANTGSISIGDSSDATAGGAVALGDTSQSLATNSIAIGLDAHATKLHSIAIGQRTRDSTTGTGRNVLIGAYTSTFGTGERNTLIGNSVASPSGASRCTVVGADSDANQTYQTVIGSNITSADVTTDVPYSLKIGVGDVTNLNLIHLHTKGHFELYGDEAQIVFPNYIVTGSPVGLPASADEGAVIYDSVAKGLQLYGGSPTGWSAIGGGGSVALNDLTDVTLGSPVTNEVLTFDGSNWINAAASAGGEAYVDILSSGTLPSAAGTDCIAIGANAYTNSEADSIAIGTNAYASRANCIAIGPDTGPFVATTAVSSIAIGDAAKVRGSFDIAIGRYARAEAGSGQIVIGNSARAFNTSTGSITIGNVAQTEKTKQISIGEDCDTSSVTTDVAYSTKLGFGDEASAAFNMIHLFSKGKLELYGDEAQYIFPSYAVTGSPIDVPANSIEGGVIYDSVAKGLELYDGTSWSAIGGGGSVALNDLTDVVVAGSPAVTNQVLTYDGSNWINSTPGVVNNWIHAHNGVDFVTAPLAIQDRAIAIGNNASTGFADSIAIGTNTTATFKGVALGQDSAAINYGVSIGFNANGLVGGNQVAIGKTVTAGTTRDVVIGSDSSTINSGSGASVIVGSQTTANGGKNVCIGFDNDVTLTNQIAIGENNKSAAVTTDVAYSVKLGAGAPTNAFDKNLLHLFSKGKLELYGDEAQYIFPSYAVTGSPVEVPANSVEGGVIYDSTAKALELYDGTSWSAIGGGATATKPTYEAIVISGSPVSAIVTTTVSTVALTGNPLLAGLLVFRNGAQQSEGVMTGSPLEPSEDFAVTGANELTFGTGVLEVGNKINIYVFE